MRMQSVDDMHRPVAQDSPSNNGDDCFWVLTTHGANPQLLATLGDSACE